MSTFAHLGCGKILLLCLLLFGWGHQAAAQLPATAQRYTDARAGYQLSYPAGWQVHQGTDNTTAFYAGPDWATSPAVVTLRLRPLPDNRKDLNLLTAGQLDSLWLSVTALPQSRVFRIDQYDAGRYQQLRYDYAYTPAPAGPRRRVVGRRVWRDGYEYRLEYRAATSQQDRYLTAGQQLMESFRLLDPGPPSRRTPAGLAAASGATPPVVGCDDKFYGIAALRIHNDIWEDDCRTIHEFSLQDPTRSPKIHRQVLPFQSYALAKGFDNCLYSVTKAPTNAPEYVYRYNPATRQGKYTTWQLPAQGSENVWISGATDEKGNLYFSTSDGNKLVKVNPADDAVTVVWQTDPLRQASYFPALGFAGAGTHANFCFDTTRTLYEVYSTDGSLLRINLNTRRPAPDLLPLDGLPERGGYSGILLQLDAAGNRRLLLAGPKALYRVDLATQKVTRIRQGVYTDLAGCNLFRMAPAPAPVAAAPSSVPVAPKVAPWRGRVLDAATLQPLTRTRLRLRGPAPVDTTLLLAAGGAFRFPARPNYAYTAQLQLSGYLPIDSLFVASPGPYAQDIVLRPLAVGTTIRLENVQFAQAQAELLPASYAPLNDLLALLTQTPLLTIELRGHTDNVGDPQKNVELSQQRVAAVKAYLVAHGISANRISGVGLGGAEPRASNAQESTRRLNRRVEFRVTGGG